MAEKKSVMAVIRASRPTFKNDHDKATFAVHATFIAAGYILAAAGPEAFDDSALSSSSTDEVGIDHWNDREDEYAFLYANPDKGFNKILVKCLVLGDKLAIDALANGASELVHLEIKVKDYVNVNGGTNYTDQFKNLENLVENVNEEILNKLYGSEKPTSSKSGAASDLPSSSSSGETREKSRQNPRGIAEPGVGHYQPRGPMVDPSSGIVVPPIVPFGGDDLFPGPGAGIFPTRGDHGGGSMLFGPNDPRWFSGDPPFAFPGVNPGAPPGARFDPFGPPGVPGFEPNRFTRNPPRRPGEPHPDLQHFAGGGDFI
jgi:proteasome inhibitor subunit 1 (PI31)